MKQELHDLETRVSVLESRVADLRVMLWWVLGLVITGGVATNAHLYLAR